MNTRNIRKIVLGSSLCCCMIAALTSCADDLDSDKYFDDRRSIESVFTDRNQSLGWLAQSFSFLKGALADCKTKETDIDGAYFQCFGDDMVFGDRDMKMDLDGNARTSFNALMLGDYDEEVGKNAWIDAYKGIYQASIFIHNIDRNVKMTEEERSDFKGQARFVRAYYYWLLLRKYGPIPLMPDEGADYTQKYEELAIPRSSYEECATFIADEMLKAVNEMKDWNRFEAPNNTDAEFIVRPTKGAALAVRALAYIYAASPLANGQLQNGTHPSQVTDLVARELVNKDGTPLLSREYDESKWARAAAACRDVMECDAHYELYHYGIVVSGTNEMPQTITPHHDGDFSEKNWPDGYANIDPYLSYRRLFDGEIGLTGNTEIIFTRGYNLGNGIKSFVAHQMPNSPLHGWNCHALTQKMVDAYYMNDGSDCSGKDSEYGEGDGSARKSGWTTTDNYNQYKPLPSNVSLQYANREPRFYASVAYNGSRWWNNNPNENEHYPQIFYYRASGAERNNGYSNTSRYLRTGIGVMKFVNPADYQTGENDWGHITDKYEPAIRYADILLMYAEALNELQSSYQIKSWDGKQTYTISRDINEIKRGIRPVRIRAGIPDYQDGEYANQDVLRQKIKRERMIEFLAEGKRYYDLRRWMDAPIELAKPIYGCNVMMTSAQRDQFQNVVQITSLPTVFSEKMYFWPIHFSELKHNNQLVQNPGWKYND